MSNRTVGQTEKSADSIHFFIKVYKWFIVKTYKDISQVTEIICKLEESQPELLLYILNKIAGDQKIFDFGSTFMALQI